MANTQKAVGTQTTTVSVNHWRYARQVRVTPEHVALQVTVPSCSHCPTCQRRVQEFSETLARKPEVVHEWRWQDGARWVLIPRKGTAPPFALLEQALEVRIGRY